MGGVCVWGGYTSRWAAAGPGPKPTCESSSSSSSKVKARNLELCQYSSSSALARLICNGTARRPQGSGCLRGTTTPAPVVPGPAPRPRRPPAPLTSPAPGTATGRARLAREGRAGGCRAGHAGTCSPPAAARPAVSLPRALRVPLCPALPQRTDYKSQRTVQGRAVSGTGG